MAVYTDVSDEELEAFIGSYAIGALTSFKGIAEGVENSNYLVHTTSGRYILTLYEKRVRREDLPYFLALMQHLAARRISCPLPVRDREGRALKELAGRPAALITFLEGLWVRRPSIDHCAGLGEALAHFHLAGADFPMFRANSLSLPGWGALFAAIGSGADRVTPGLAGEIEKELRHLEGHWPADLPQGVIHADLFPDNVFFLGDKVSGLIDFYFACTDMLAYDIAICLNAWCFESDASFNITKARAFLQAYEGVRPLKTNELAALPTLARGAALRFLLNSSGGIEPFINVTSYIDFTTRLMLVTGLVFELPLFVMGLAKLHIVSSRKLIGW
jgi:homoserine kinase type II